MKYKECFKCNKIKPLNEFYKHSEMIDGYLNKCKECTKKDSQKYRWENIEKIRTYDRERRKWHNITDKEKEKFKMNSKKWREANPKKAKAHRIVNRKLTRPNKCEICNKYHSKIEGHHPDYNQPLKVIWVCSVCHHKIHNKINHESIAIF